MRLAGYGMERGINPETVFNLEHDDRLIYYAMAELNQEQRIKDITAAVYNAIAMFWNEINRLREKDGRKESR